MNWKMLLIGIVMLLVLVVVSFIVVSSRVGFWKAVASFTIATLYLVWAIAAAWFIHKGGN